MKPLSYKYLVEFVITLFIIVFFTSTSAAQLNLSPVFGNGMVLQRDMVIPVWGSSTAGSTVTITIAGNSQSTIVESNGKWRIELPAMSAGGPFTMTITSGTQTLTRTDVYFGDVWIAAGQSNMEFQVNGLNEAASIRASANDQKIRQFKVPKGLANEPSDELPTGSAWTPATASYINNFTAVGYYFAKYLRENIDIPIGILNVSYGGCRIEAYMSDEMLGYDENDTTFSTTYPERQPTLIYNKMIYPLIGYPIKGVIWYQAESNGDKMEDAIAYGDNFINLITSWRNLWGQGDFPFLWVQLPNYGTVYDQPQTWDAWPQLRAQQSLALSLPNTGEAITIDVGDVDIHPKNKQPVGYRLSLLARKIVYGEDIVCMSPRYSKNLLRDDGKVEVDFNYIGGGLKAKGSQNGEVYGFAMAGEDNKLYWANAVIENNKVLVWSDQVPEPTIIRYAWEYNPATANLYNMEDLPAAPFLAYVNPGFKIVSFKSARSAVETGQSTTLTWLVFNASSVTLDGIEVDTSGTKTITPAETTTYTLIAVNRDDANEKDTATVTVEVLDPNQINRALNKTVMSSTYELCCGDDRRAILAVDGDLTTRWSSAWQPASGTTQADPNLDDNPDDEWITVDLGESIDIDRVILFWETAYGSEYNIDISYDGYLWNTVKEERNSDGGEDNFAFNPPVSGRFIRMHGLKRATQWGYSLWEFAVYGTLSNKKPPEVKISTNLGNVTKAGTQVTITANTSDADGTIQKVTFYVDGQLYFDDDANPFQTNWTPASNGDYEITAVVVDNDGLTVQSAPFTIYVKDISAITKYEAEKAVYTGQGTVKSSSAASGQKYLEMRDAWTIIFNNIGASTAGEYLLIIAYQLTFESPKIQYLVVNGDTVDAAEFTAPNITSWLQKGIKINLKAGINEVAFHGFWNWMSFDYIGIEGTQIVSVHEPNVLPNAFSLAQNYPNPFNPSTVITYTLPNSGSVKLEVYNIMGQRVATLVDGFESAGIHKLQFNACNIASGVYFYRLQFNSNTITKSMVLLH